MPNWRPRGTTWTKKLPPDPGEAGPTPGPPAGLRDGVARKRFYSFTLWEKVGMRAVAWVVAVPPHPSPLPPMGEREGWPGESEVGRLAKLSAADTLR